ncbi:hypothetical protein EG834_20065, partial [bacterium]|nr:hypothetical protein [bacterium]
MTFDNTTIAYALKRLVSHRRLALGQLVGLAAAVALAVAVPLYADGVNYSLLNTSLTESTGQTRRRPFDFVFRYIGSWYGDLSAEQYRPIDAYLNEQAAPAIGLPLSNLTRYAATTNLQLYPASENLAPRDRLDLVKLAFLTGIFDRIELVEGRLPDAAITGGAAIEVLASLDLANNLDLRAGQTYTLYT